MHQTKEEEKIGDPPIVWFDASNIAAPDSDIEPYSYDAETDFHSFNAPRRPRPRNKKVNALLPHKPATIRAMGPDDYDAGVVLPWLRIGTRD